MRLRYKLKDRIKMYERSYDFSIEQSIKRHAPGIYKKGWFTKSFLDLNKPITEEVLEEYITKKLSHYNFSFGYQRTPKQIKEYIDNKIKLYRPYIAGSSSKLILDLDTYDYWMNTDYSLNLYFDCS